MASGQALDPAKRDGLIYRRPLNPPYYYQYYYYY